jgi:uncharacterized protein YaiL (DUF2058 family)
MTDSLRDQLLGLGFKPAPRPERKPDQPRRPEHKSGRQPDRRPDPRGANAKPGAQATPGGQRPAARDQRPGGGPRQGQRQGEAGREGQRPRPPARDPRKGGDIDLAKAYAIRAQREKDERIEAERRKQEEARLRREAREKLAEFLKDKSLNLADADIARHFEYGGKIKRIHVNEAQLKDLNAGVLGVVQHNGRYLLVTAAVLAEAEAIFAPAVALRVDPDAPVADEYADPQYQVPDDLVW